MEAKLPPSFVLLLRCSAKGSRMDFGPSGPQHRHFEAGLSGGRHEGRCSEIFLHSGYQQTPFDVVRRYDETYSPEEFRNNIRPALAGAKLGWPKILITRLVPKLSFAFPSERWMQPTRRIG